VLSGRGLCDELITRPEESYRLWCVVVCDLETSKMRRPWPALGRSATRGAGEGKQPLLSFRHIHMSMSWLRPFAFGTSPTDARVQSQPSQYEILGLINWQWDRFLFQRFGFSPLPTASFHQCSVLTRPLSALYILSSLERRITTCLTMPYFFMFACDRIQFLCCHICCAFSPV